MSIVYDTYKFDLIDSTNSEARRQVLSGIKLPALFVAKRQTAGRGRRGKSFWSVGGLYMTLALRAEDINTDKITTLASVATAKVIEKLSGETVGIKWVNDIYKGGLKICGILAETVTDNITGKPLAVIIGIGANLNVNAFPKELDGIAGSLKLKGIEPYTLAEKIAETLLDMIEENEDFMEYYKSRSTVIGKDICYTKNGECYIATATNINPDGSLEVLLDDGETEILTSGEISLIKK